MLGSPWGWSLALPLFLPGRNRSAGLPGEGTDRIDPAKDCGEKVGQRWNRTPAEGGRGSKCAETPYTRPGWGGYFLIHERMALSLEIGRSRQGFSWDCGIEEKTREKIH